MSNQGNWREFWEAKAAPDVSDFEFDRGTSQRDREMESLSDAELLDFIDAGPSDTLLDAGCGTGVNILLLHSRVRQIIAMDYAAAAVTRCQRRLAAHRITNAEVSQGDISATSLPDASVDRILCMSVLQYIDNEQVRSALREFARVLRPGGTLVLHAKNLSSLYLSTLWLMKRLLLALKKETKLEYFRTFGWYVRELRAAGFRVETYRSLNLFIVERMPRRLVLWLQRLELSHQGQRPFSWALLRRLGSDLKLRAQLAAR
jgi:ubiquinone/menaquinone biosynthesis C-methylase UbiE